MSKEFEICLFILFHLSIQQLFAEYPQNASHCGGPQKCREKTHFLSLGSLRTSRFVGVMNRETQKHKVSQSSGIHLMMDTEFTCPTIVKSFIFL